VGERDEVHEGGCEESEDAGVVGRDNIVDLFPKYQCGTAVGDSLSIELGYDINAVGVRLWTTYQAT
jgi:hypothetical protein